MNQIGDKARKSWGLKNCNVCGLRANVDTAAGGSTIALRESCSGELKIDAFIILAVT